MNKLILFACWIAHRAARGSAASGWSKHGGAQKTEDFKLACANDKTKIKPCVEKFSLALHYPPRVEDQPCLLLFREGKEKKPPVPSQRKGFSVVL